MSPAAKYIIVLTCIVASALFACSFAFAGKQKNPFEGNPDAIVAGAKLYLKHCASCHGRMAQGGRAPDLTDDYWMYGNGDREVFDSIFDGRASGYMPPMKGRLTEDDTWKIVTFLRKIADKN